MELLIAAAVLITALIVSNVLMGTKTIEVDEESDRIAHELFKQRLIERLK